MTCHPASSARWSLVAGRVADAQMEATILDFGRRGALKLEESAKDRLRIHLLSKRDITEGYERRLWQHLTKLADARNVIPASKVATLPGLWTDAKDILHQELCDRGWFTPQATGQRQLLNIAATVAVLVAFVGLFPTLSGGEAWGWLGILAAVAAAITGYVSAYTLPETTPDGDREAAPWRAYLEGLRHHLPAFDVEHRLQTGIVYAAAFGIAAITEGLFYQASKQGIAPRWMSADHSTGTGTWMAYHSAFSPPHTTTSGGSFHSFSGGGFSSGGGGAGAGGGGGGGGF